MNIGDVVRLKGCTLKGRSLETSCGCSALDALLCGGLAVSTFCVIDELNSRAYADSLARYFIAEGLYSGHDVLVVDPMGEDKLWKGVPTRIESQTMSNSSSIPPPPLQKMSDPQEDLRIAFRYAAKSQVNSSIGDKNRYDLGKPLPERSPLWSDSKNFSIFLIRLRSLLRNSHAIVFATAASETMLKQPADEFYESLYMFLSTLCKSDLYNKTRAPTKNLLRVVIGHLGSPLWSDSKNFSIFLIRLRSLLRNSHAIVFATAASETMLKQPADELFVTSDLYIQLVAISEEEQRKLSPLDKYHGYLRILRLPRITSAGTHSPPADLVFIQKRNSFDVNSHAIVFATAASETMLKQPADELFVTSDLYIQLFAISEEEQRKLSPLDKYHGYLRILRLPRITSAGTHCPPADLVFIQKRNSFDVSILHLPPAFGDETQNSKGPCGIDF
ncbi:unnamed protein product [Strongylus vulgaris]|uniref:Elongator complex protein 4 n=1 Tax=Strongylus vulgaris TaxID=40348 RepID=A0A3P7JLX3_STRVU|nr:unnamed protein product [Strongylus vulgaris]